jgi:hypothetical protein
MGKGMFVLVFNMGFLVGPGEISFYNSDIVQNDKWKEINGDWQLDDRIFTGNKDKFHP